MRILVAGAAATIVTWAESGASLAAPPGPVKSATGSAVRAQAQVRVRRASVHSAPVGSAAADAGAQATSRRAEKPLIGARPAWVRFTPAPVAPTDDAGGALRTLLWDRQVNYGDEGDEIYNHFAVQILTQQGLQGSNQTFQWNPEVETLTVNALRILRGGQVIDVLGSQALTVLRRESNLEMSMLDGRLSAVVQPEGLQVGDVLEVETTIHRRDPTLKGRSEHYLSIPATAKVDQLKVRETWTGARDIHWKISPGVEEPRLVRTAAGSELTLEIKDLEPPKPPLSAPARYSVIGLLQASEFRDWAEVASVMAPLYARAGTLAPDSPVKAEARKIAAASTDPKVRAAAALHLVQHQVRYLFLGMNLGAYTPAPADTTWSRRFGDCKGKTVLLLALLHELGVEAEPAFVSATHSDGVDERLPAMEAFDHVIVRAAVGGRIYWLDPTRPDDGSLDKVEVPPFRWALPVRPAGATLEKLVRDPPSLPEVELRMALDASAGPGAAVPAHVEEVFRADPGLLLKEKLANLPNKQAEKLIRKMFEDSLKGYEVNTVSWSWDDAAREEKLVMDGDTRLDWRVYRGSVHRAHLPSLGVLGANKTFKREPGYGVDAPYAVSFPYFLRATETIILPDNGDGFTLKGGDMDKTVGATQYRRNARIDKAVFKVQSDTRTLAPEFPAADAGQVSAGMLSVLEDVLLIEDGGRRSKTAEGLRFTRPISTAFEYADRAAAFFVRADPGDDDRVLADISRAVELKKDDADYWIGRGLYRAFLNRDVDQGFTDCTEALKLRSNSSNAHEVRGFLFYRKARYAEALVELDQAVALNPHSGLALYLRGMTRRKTGADGSADIASARTFDPYVDRMFHKRPAL